MSWWHSQNFEDRLPFLQKRARLFQSIRNFFENQGFWEVETPILQLCPTMETHIHALKTTLREPDPSKSREIYLHTSPELAMKKLLVAGCPKIFQIAKVFRNGEASALHSPEFTMLEWYRANAGYEQSMTDCEELLKHSAQALDIEAFHTPKASCNPHKGAERLSVAEAFKTFAHIDLDQYLSDKEAFSAVIVAKSIKVSKGDNWDDLFFRVMAEKIEPYLGMGRPTILYDYPLVLAALARKKPKNPNYAERFELYVCGVELANAFGELTNPAEQIYVGAWSRLSRLAHALCLGARSRPCVRDRLTRRARSCRLLAAGGDSEHDDAVEHAVPRLGQV